MVKVRDLLRSLVLLYSQCLNFLIGSVVSD